MAAALEGMRLVGAVSRLPVVQAFVAADASHRKLCSK